MKRWMILLNRLAGFTVLSCRRRNHAQAYACLHAMFARTTQFIKQGVERLKDRLIPERSRDKQPTRVETLEPRLLFSATPIADWSFDEDDPAGTQVIDISGNGHTGALVGNSSLVSDGVLGQGVSLDGLGDRINVADSSLINLSTTTERSISLFFKADDVSVSDRKQVLYEEGGTGRGLSIYLYDGLLHAGGWNAVSNESNWQPTFISSDAIVSGQWHHVALTLDGTATTQPDAMKAYLDGTEIGSAVGSQLWARGGDVGIGDVDADTVFHDGSASVTGGHGFAGTLDNVQVYNQALTPTEIQGLSAILSQEAYFKFDQASGTVVTDATGNGAVANIEGGATWQPTTGGVILGGLQLDGVNDAVRIPDLLPATSSPPPFTFSVWFNPDELPTDDKMVVVAGDIGFFSEAASISIGSSSEHGNVLVAGRPELLGLFGEYEGTTAVVAGQWNHLAMSYDGTTTSIYLNGNLEIEGQIDLGDAFTHGLIGRLGSSAGGVDNFKGSIDEVRLFSAGLSTQQVQGLWSEVLGTPAPSINLTIPGLDEVDEQSVGAAVGVLGNRFGDDRDSLAQAEQDAIYGEFYASTDTRLASASLNVTGGTGDWHLEFDDTELAIWQQLASGDYVRVTSGVALSTVALTETIQLKIEGVSKSVSAGDSALKAVLTAEDGSVYEDQIDLTVFDADLAIDSDNNAGLGLPDSDFAEQQAEAEGDAKIALINDTGSLLVAGNAWKQTALAYTATPDTVLAFDYKSNANGEMHVIGVSNGSSFPIGYQLHGTQVTTNPDWRVSHNDYAVGEGWRRYEIAIGQDYTGSITDLMLIADDDLNATGASLYRDIVMYEAVDPAGTLTRLDLAQAVFSSAAGAYAGQDAGGSTAQYIAPAGFTPSVLKVDLPDDADPATALVNIDYSAWAPNGSTPEASTGHMRLWLKAAEDSTRSFDAVGDGGDYLAPGSYTVAELGLTGGATQIIVWVEAIEQTDSLLAVLPLGNGDTTDQSGNGHHVSTTTGDPTATTGPDGLVDTALHFDGNDALVIDSLPELTDSLSVGMWAQSDTATWSHYGVLASRPGSFVLHPDLNTNDIAFKIWIEGVKHEVYYRPDASFDITAWHHYLGTYDAASGEMNLWIDGEVVVNKNTGGGAIDQATGPLYLGQHNGINRYLQGSLSDVRIDTQALGTLEAQERATVRPSEGLLGLWTLGTDQGSDATGGPNANFYASDLTTGPDGLPGSATQLNGTNEYVQILGSGNNPNGVPPLTTGLTAGIWAKSDTQTWNANGVLIERRPTFVLGSVGTSSLFMHVNVSGSGWQSVGVDLTQAIPGFTLTDWHHYAGTHDPTTGEVKLYVDGAEIYAETVVSGNLQYDHWATFVGRDTLNGTRYLDGALAQATLYDRPLDADEVATVAQIPSSAGQNNQGLTVAVSPYGISGVSTTNQIKVNVITVSQRPIQNLSVEVLSPSEAVLTWQPDETATNGYTVHVSSDGGTTFTQWQTAEQSVSGALVEGLSEDTAYVYAVTPTPISTSGVSNAASNNASSVSSALTVAAATPVRAQGAVAQATYLVGFDLGYEQTSLIRNAGTTYSGDGTLWLNGNQAVVIDQKTYEVVTAESADAAIRKAVNGKADIISTEGDSNTYNFPGNGHAFKIQGQGEDYEINLEDTFEWTSIDEDFNDWTWEVTVKQAPQLFVTIDDVTISEPAAGADNAEATFTITINADPSESIDVDWDVSTAGPVFATDGLDFISDFGTVNFTPGGDRSRKITVDVIGDNQFEPNEFFQVTLSDPGYSGSIVLDGPGYGTIIDSTKPTISINDITVQEPTNAPTTPAIFTVSMSAPPEETVFVEWSTRELQPESAAEGDDYTPVNQGILKFDPNGPLNQQVSVDVLADAWIEPDEFFNVVLTTSSPDVVIGKGQGLGTIRDPDGSSIVDIDVDSNNDDVINAMDDPIEANDPGKFIVVHDQPSGSFNGERIEAQLSAMTTGNYDPDYDWTVRLRISDGADRISVHDQQTGGNELLSGGGDFYEWDIDDMPQIVWVQGEQLGSAELTLEVFGASNGSGSSGGSGSSSSMQDVVKVVVATVVNSTDDDGDDDLTDKVPLTGQTNIPGNPEITLRSAIEQANANPGTDVIFFDIPSVYAANGIYIINPQSALPAITDKLLIWGDSQPGWAGSPIIEVDGAGLNANGFSVEADGSLINGLAVNSFGKSGISIPANGVTIEESYIGVKPDGTTASGNVRHGIELIGARDAQIQGNVISGNMMSGVYLNGAEEALISDNHIGTNADGTQALANTNHGVVIDPSASDTIVGTDGNAGSGNVISGNGMSGVYDSGNATIIGGNKIGTNKDGDAQVANTDYGVWVTGSTPISPLIGIDGNNGEGNLISGNGKSGVYVDARDEVVIGGNKIGTNLAGDQAIANGHHGVSVAGDTSDTLIGSDGVKGEGNLISGNTQAGVHIDASPESLIGGNKIGTNLAGNQAIANGHSGISIVADSTGTLIGSDGATGESNLISGNTHSGIYISGSNESLIGGNKIGTDLAGGQPLGNGLHGVSVANDSTDTLIGSDGVKGEANLISGNTQTGVHINASDDSLIGGNKIGTNLAGDQAIANGHSGISIVADSTGTLIGSDGVKGEGNLISGNTHSGIYISGSNESLIGGNKIGTNLAGEDADLGNGHNGVWITGGASDTLIGNDTVVGVANTISYNVMDGIYVEEGTGNQIRQNSIYENGELGIDLGPDGVTENDTGDSDAGSNELQNFPTITSIELAPLIDETWVRFDLDSTPDTEFLIEFFASDVPDPSGSGEGQEYLDTITVTTNSEGKVSENFFTSPENLRKYITATATNKGTGNTSEFSKRLIVGDIFVDNDRDGLVEFNGEDKTSIDNRFLFWVNNDRDRYISNDDFGDYVSDVTDGMTDASSLYVGDSSGFGDVVRRDLEDFARAGLWINTELLENGVVIEFELVDATAGMGLRIHHAPARTHNVEGELSATSHILDQNASSTISNEILNYNNYPSGSASLLREVNEGDGAVSLHFFDNPNNPGDSWRSFSDNDELSVIPVVFEAIGEGQGTLEVSFKKLGTTDPLYVSELHLDFRDVRALYEHWTVDVAGLDDAWGSDSTDPKDPQYNLMAGNIKRIGNSGINVRQFAETDEYTVFVHGWNTSPEWRPIFGDTTYKRLYWQGYTGSFGIYNWPTTEAADGFFGSLNNQGTYNRGEEIAWHSSHGLAKLLTDKIASHNGDVSVLAHSMGNVVLSEALYQLQQEGKSVKTAILSQGAVSSHFYDGTLPVTVNALLEARLGVSGASGFNYYGLSTTAQNAQYTVGGLAPRWSVIDQAATTLANFYNPDDYALGIWEWNNSVARPTSVLDGNTGFGDLSYEFFRTLTASMTKQDGNGPVVPLTFANDTDAYEIYSHLFGSSAGPIGSTDVRRGQYNIFDVDVRLDDTTVYDFGDSRWAHSAQWHGILAGGDAAYWEKVYDLVK